MINTNRLLKTTVAWVSIVYTLCFLSSSSMFGMRSGFMSYGFHMDGSGMGRNMTSFGTFVSGLIIWNLIALVGVGLFAVLYNHIKE